MFWVDVVCVCVLGEVRVVAPSVALSVHFPFCVWADKINSTYLND